METYFFIIIGRGSDRRKFFVKSTKYNQKNIEKTEQLVKINKSTGNFNGNCVASAFVQQALSKLGKTSPFNTSPQIS